MKQRWKPLLTRAKTEVHETVSHDSILEVKALKGFIHSKLILNRNVTMRKQNEITEDVKPSV